MFQKALERKGIEWLRIRRAGDRFLGSSLGSKVRPWAEFCLKAHFG